MGDSLNPIFSTIEFHALNSLRLLDLSGNKIKAIEEGILKGCHKLQVSECIFAYLQYNLFKFTLQKKIEVILIDNLLIQQEITGFFFYYYH